MVRLDMATPKLWTIWKYNSETDVETQVGEPLPEKKAMLTLADLEAAETDKNVAYSARGHK
jgi:hypothetical protein